jgi:hypothetical protein
MPELPHNPSVHTPATKAERSATIAAAGKAAADRGRNAQTTEGAVEAALTVAAERAAARDAGRPSEIAKPEPVVQHTDKTEPDAKEPEVETAPAKEPETVDLKVRLKRKQREAQRQLQEEQNRFTRERQEFETQRKGFQQVIDRNQHLEKLRAENPTQWLKEVGLTDEIHKQFIREKLAEGKPEGLALKAETEAQKTSRELAELKQQLAQRDFHAQNEQIRAKFVQEAKAEEYPVLNSIYGEDPQGLVDYGENWAQPRFKATHNRFGSNQELLFNMECIEAAKIARATGNEKLLAAVKESRESGNLRALRAAFGKPKPSDKEKASKKQPPGPAAQSRTSQPGDDTKPLTRKERLAKAARAGREAQDKMARGETQYDPAYLAGSK